MSSKIKVNKTISIRITHVLEILILSIITITTTGCAMGPTTSSAGAQLSFSPEVYATNPADFSRGYNSRQDSFRSQDVITVVVANWSGSSVIGTIRLFRDGTLVHSQQVNVGSQLKTAFTWKPSKPGAYILNLEESGIIVSTHQFQVY